MSFVVAALRIAAAAAGIVAIAGQWFYSAARTQLNPFNFFGYFTIQGNLIAVAVFLVAAYFLFAGRAQPGWLVWARAASAAYMATVGIVYNTLLVDVALAGSFNLQWSNDILHRWLPLYVVLDWVLFGDRAPVPWRRLWWMLVYPLVWCLATLVRAAFLDGFYAYPFLDVRTLGAGVVPFILGIAVFIALVGAGAIWLSRVRILRFGV